MNQDVTAKMLKPDFDSEVSGLVHGYLFHEQRPPQPIVVVKFFWTRRSDGRVMHRRATGRQGWPAFRTVRVI
ncbi:hypothetical protein ACI3RV_15140, partial [Klebsiella pneumoniae]